MNQLVYSQPELVRTILNLPENVQKEMILPAKSKSRVEDFRFIRYHFHQFELIVNVIQEETLISLLNKHVLEGIVTSLVCYIFLKMVVYDRNKYCQYYRFQALSRFHRPITVLFSSLCATGQLPMPVLDTEPSFGKVNEQIDRTYEEDEKATASQVYMPFGARAVQGSDRHWQPPTRRRLPTCLARRKGVVEHERKVLAKVHICPARLTRTAGEGSAAARQQVFHLACTGG